MDKQPLLEKYEQWTSPKIGRVANGPIQIHRRRLSYHIGELRVWMRHKSITAYLFMFVMRSSKKLGIIDYFPYATFFHPKREWIAIFGKMRMAKLRE